jgi:hypothetical protein
VSAPRAASTARVRVQRAACAVAWCGLVGLVLLPPCLFFAGALGHDAVKAWMLAGTALWFAATSLAAALRGDQGDRT